MEFIYITRQLWRLRALVAVAVVVAVVASLAVAYRIGLVPPSLHSKHTLVYGAASTQILVDSQNSAIGDLRQGLEPLINRAGMLAALVSTTEVSDALDRYLSLPPGAIDIQVPTLNASQISEAGAAKRANQLVGEPKGYRLKADWDGAQPVINIFTQAPTARGALALANATFAVLSKVEQNAELRPNPPPYSRVRLVQLGLARGGVVNPGATGQLAAVVGLGSFIASLLLILLGARVVRAWREAAALDGSPEQLGLVPSKPHQNGEVADPHAVAGAVGLVPHDDHPTA